MIAFHGGLMYIYIYLWPEDEEIDPQEQHKQCYQVLLYVFPMIAFPRVRTTLYIYFLVSTSRVCIVYVVKENESSRGARSINGRGA